MSKAIDCKNASKLNIRNNFENNQENQIYDLYAIIVHAGSCRQFGHYYSYCKSMEDSNRWFKCNDETVSQLNAEGALNKQAYILFYQKRAQEV